MGNYNRNLFLYFWKFKNFRMSERTKRSRNKGSDARQAALDKIKQARQTGTVADYDIGEVDNIFEEVDEDDYEIIREKRSENWIVGDDRGYYDDGEEFYDNSDDEKSLSKDEKKKLADAKKKKKFAAGSANITSMFLQSKKKK